MQKYILGGYTRRENDGIYQINFDSNTGKFTNKELISKIDGPTYVALSADKKLLFAIAGENGRGGIDGFKLVGDSYQKFNSNMGADGTGCHLTYCNRTSTIYDANYHLGQINVYKIDLENNGEIEHIQRIQHAGSSVHPNQEKSHVHCTSLNKAEDMLFVCDLGTDIVSTYQVNEDGTLTLKHEAKMPEGTGPRHLVLHPSEKYAYVIGELANTTLVLSVSNDGELKVIQEEVNIPEEFVETSSGAAIRLTKDGKFLYVSTRFHNVISSYKVSEDGKTLTFNERVDSHGEIPRDFILDETENYLLVAHQDSDKIVVFDRDTETGQLTFNNDETIAPECVCIAHA